MTSIALQFFISETFKRVQVTFIWSIFYHGHYIKKGVNNSLRVFACALFFGVKSFKFLVGEEESQ